jgi:hypothetical protein
VTCFFPKSWPSGEVTNGGLSWFGPKEACPPLEETGFIVQCRFDLLEDLHQRLIHLGVRLGVVESCTGGLLGSLFYQPGGLQRIL